MVFSFISFAVFSSEFPLLSFYRFIDSYTGVVRRYTVINFVPVAIQAMVAVSQTAEQDPQRNSSGNDKKPVVTRFANEKTRTDIKLTLINLDKT